VKTAMMVPPVKAVVHEGSTLLVDGHHRARAAKMAGIERIPLKSLICLSSRIEIWIDVLQGRMP
jgi:hypothetical protein